MAKKEEKQDTFKKKVLRAPKNKYFWVCDGTVIRTIRELADALDTMDNNVYQYHANQTKNDFATWVEDVFDLKTLGKELRSAWSKERAVIACLRHLLR